MLTRNLSDPSEIDRFVANLMAYGHLVANLSIGMRHSHSIIMFIPNEYRDEVKEIAAIHHIKMIMQGLVDGVGKFVCSYERD